MKNLKEKNKSIIENKEDIMNRPKISEKQRREIVERYNFIKPIYDIEHLRLTKRLEALEAKSDYCEQFNAIKRVERRIYLLECELEGYKLNGKCYIGVRTNRLADLRHKKIYGGK